LEELSTFGPDEKHDPWHRLKAWNILNRTLTQSEGTPKKWTYLLTYLSLTVVADAVEMPSDDRGSSLTKAKAGKMSHLFRNSSRQKNGIQDVPVCTPFL